MQAIEEQRRREEELAKLTPQEAARYNQLVNQLAWMAGIDPTGMFITNDLRGGATIEPPEIISQPFRVIDPARIDEVVSRAEADALSQLESFAEYALRQAARRGLAGASLVDQANAYAQARAAESLADFRASAEMEAERLQRQYEQQARAMLMGLNPERLPDYSASFTTLMNQLAADQAGWGSLLSGLVSFGMEELLSPWLRSRNPSLYEREVELLLPRIRWGR